jgi:Mg-chelatase subunit ChlD
MNTLQTSLEKSLPIVAAAYGEQFGVNIVLSGKDAYTDGKTIVLPLLKSNSGLRDVLFGYLAHESAHVRGSDFDTLKKCKNQTEKSFTNIIEDIRIEQLIQDVFPGTRLTLDAMWTYIVEQGMSPPATPEDNEGTQLHQYLLHRLRSEVLHRESSTLLAESSQQVMEQTFPIGFFVRLDGLFAKYLDKLTCSDDCLKLARAIIKALKDAEEEEKQNQEATQDNSDSSQDDQSQTADQPGNDNQDSSMPSPGQTDSSQDDDADQGEGEPQPQQSNEDPSGGTSLHESLINETDLPEDAISQLSEQLAEQAQEDNDGDPIAINTSSVGSDANNNGETSNLKTGILASSAIRSQLQGLLHAQTREQQWLHTSGKRVDGKRLTRLSSGDSRIFIKRDETRRTDTAVHILLDSSGSMHTRQDIANQATVSLALAVSSIPKCDIATSMFPGVGGGDVSPVIRRGQPVRANLGRFAVNSSGGTPLAEAMLYAARELAVSRRQRKVLIIITDGAPNNGSEVRYMNSLIASHIDIYAIGINSTAVSKYFENWSVIDNVKELQKALFQIAGKFLELH